MKIESNIIDDKMNLVENKMLNPFTITTGFLKASGKFFDVSLRNPNKLLYSSKYDFIMESTDTDTSTITKLNNFLCNYSKQFEFKFEKITNLEDYQGKITIILKSGNVILNSKSMNFKFKIYDLKDLTHNPTVTKTEYVIIDKLYQILLLFSEIKNKYSVESSVINESSKLFYLITVSLYGKIFSEYDISIVFDPTPDAYFKLIPNNNSPISTTENKYFYREIPAEILRREMTNNSVKLVIYTSMTTNKNGVEIEFDKLESFCDYCKDSPSTDCCGKNHSTSFNKYIPNDKKPKANICILNSIVKPKVDLNCSIVEDTPLLNDCESIKSVKYNQISSNLKLEFIKNVKNLIASKFKFSYKYNNKVYKSRLDSSGYGNFAIPELILTKNLFQILSITNSLEYRSEFNEVEILIDVQNEKIKRFDCKSINFLNFYCNSINTCDSQNFTSFYGICLKECSINQILSMDGECLLLNNNFYSESLVKDFPKNGYYAYMNTLAYLKFKSLIDINTLFDAKKNLLSIVSNNIEYFDENCIDGEIVKDEFSLDFYCKSCDPTEFSYNNTCLSGCPPGFQNSKTCKKCINSIDNCGECVTECSKSLLKIEKVNYISCEPSNNPSRIIFYNLNDSDVKQILIDRVKLEGVKGIKNDSLGEEYFELGCVINCDSNEHFFEFYPDYTNSVSGFVCVINDKLHSYLDKIYMKCPNLYVLPNVPYFSECEKCPINKFQQENLCVDTCEIYFVFEENELGELYCKKCQGMFYFEKDCLMNCPRSYKNVVNNNLYYCERCKKTEYELNNICFLNQCPKGFVKNLTKDNYFYCLKCSDSYQLNDLCFDTCPNNYENIDEVDLLNNNTISYCNLISPLENGCDVLTDTCPTGYMEFDHYCFKCKEDLYLYENNCFKECPIDTLNKYTDECYSGKYCSFCPKEKKFSLNGECLENCPTGYMYDRSFICFELTCESYEYYFEAEGKIGCVLECPDQTYIFEDKDLKFCKNCDVENGLIYVDLETNTCVTECQKTTYIVGKKCHSCYSNKINAQENGCIPECPKGSTYNQETNRCINCDKFVLNGVCVDECPERYLEKNKICEKCNRFINFEENICKTNCDPNEITNLKLKECIKCPKDLKFYSFEENKCISKCQDDHDGDKANKFVCQKVSNKMYAPNFEIYVEKCLGQDEVPFKDHENKVKYSIQTDTVCITCASRGYYKYWENIKSLKCISNCIAYTIEVNNDECEYCKSNIKHDSKCVDTCPEGFELNKTIDEKNYNFQCKKCNLFYKQDNLKNTICLDKCPPGSIIMNNTKCGDICKDLNKYLFENECIENCIGKYNEFNECLVNEEPNKINDIEKMMIEEKPPQCENKSCNNSPCEVINNKVICKCENELKGIHCEFPNIEAYSDKCYLIKDLNQTIEEKKLFVECLKDEEVISNLKSKGKDLLELKSKLNSINDSNVKLDVKLSTLGIIDKAFNNNSTSLSDTDDFVASIDNFTDNLLSSNLDILKSDSSLLYSGENFSIVINDGSEKSQQESIKKGLPLVDFSECEKNLKANGILNNNSKLIAVSTRYNPKLFDKSNPDSQDMMNTKFFDENGKPVDTKICTIVSKIPIKDKTFDLKKYTEMKKNRIDVMNSKDEFFSNICINFRGQNDTDATVGMRREEFPKQSECSVGCKYKGVDEYGYTNCDCRGDIKDFSVKVSKTKFEVNVFPNLKILKCTDRLFNDFSNNKAFWFYTSHMLICTTIVILVNVFVTPNNLVDNFLNDILENDLEIEPESDKKPDKHNKNSKFDISDRSILKLKNVGQPEDKEKKTSTSEKIYFNYIVKISKIKSGNSRSVNKNSTFTTPRTKKITDSLQELFETIKLVVRNYSIETFLDLKGIKDKIVMVEENDGKKLFSYKINGLRSPQKMELHKIEISKILFSDNDLNKGIHEIDEKENSKLIDDSQTPNVTLNINTMRICLSQYTIREEVVVHKEKDIVFSKKKTLFEEFKEDNTGFIQFVWNDLKSNHSLLNLICYRSIIEPFNIRLLTFFYETSIEFAFNAALYDDETVAKRSELILSGGKPDFLFTLGQLFYKSVISVIIPIIIIKLINKLVTPTKKVKMDFEVYLAGKNKTIIKSN